MTARTKPACHIISCVDTEEKLAYFFVVVAVGFALVVLARGGGLTAKSPTFAGMTCDVEFQAFW